MAPGIIDSLGIRIAPPPIARAPYDGKTEPPLPLMVAIEEQLGLKLKPKRVRWIY
jgi:hypothetical protein